MITLLSRLLIRDFKNTSDPAVRQAYGMLCGGAGIALNACLFLLKFIAGQVSGSIAITADAFNNLSDAGSSAITLVGFKMAGQKPDSAHPFGHGRIEYISGLLVSVIILLMGAELLKSSAGKVLHPEAVDASPLVFAILIISICVKMYMYLYNRSVSRKIDSAAMMATARDSISDSVSTLAVLFYGNQDRRLVRHPGGAFCGMDGGKRNEGHGRPPPGAAAGAGVCGKDGRNHYGI